MLILVMMIVVLGLAVGLYSMLADRKNRGADTPIVAAQTCATCDGTPTAKCEQDCMMEAATKDIVYFDDEELDRFRGRPSGEYSDEEVDMFSDVLYTMKPEEVAEWCRSLNLRGIELPDQIKDETFMLVEDNKKPN